MEMYKNSIKAYKKSSDLIPGGVNSPVRAFKSVNCDPVFFERGKGSKLYDVDGNKYIDCVSSWGPLIFGHADKDTVKSINKYSKKGTSYGAPTLHESEMAKKIIDMVPSIEKVRMVNSGTEATMSAIRLARGFTGKRHIVKFAGNYHGHGDSFLIKAGSGAITLGLPDSPGVTKNIAKDTLIASFNNIESVEKLFKGGDNEIAAVIVEPVSGNMGLVLPQKGFLKALRKICTKYNSLLILDEVQSGVGRTGKMWGYENLGIEPDGFTLAKGLGGGHAIGALLVNQKANIFKPGDHASTFGGNPFACKAGLTVLQEIKRRNIIQNVCLREIQLNEGFINLINRFPNIVKSTRGIGLIQGIVLQDNSIDSKTITMKALKKGLLVIPAGKNVVRLVPPLTISRNEVNQLLAKLNLIFEEL